MWSASSNIDDIKSVTSWITAEFWFDLLYSLSDLIINETVSPLEEGSRLSKVTYVPANSVDILTHQPTPNLYLVPFS